MEEILLLEYLKKKGIISEHTFQDILGTTSEHHTTPAVEMSKEHYNLGEHFNESYAKYKVSRMWHTTPMGKQVGEVYTMEYMRDVYEKHKHTFPQSITCADVYVAIHDHYHGYNQLYRSWFGNNIDHHIIESALVYWFKDDDYLETKISILLKDK